MDDQDFAELEAAMEPTGSTPDVESAPASDTEDLSLQDTQTPDTAETPEPVEAVAETAPESESVPDEVHSKIVELQQQLAEREAKDAEREQQFQNRIAEAEAAYNEKLAQEDEQRSQEFYQELLQEDPERAAQFQERRNFLAWKAQQADTEARGSYSALEAATLAMEYHLAPEVMQQIVQDAAELAKYPSYEQKVHLLNARRQAVQGKSAEVDQLRRELQELRNQLEAKSRPIAADVVEGGRTGGGSWQQQWENAADFDEAFALIS